MKIELKCGVFTAEDMSPWACCGMYAFRDLYIEWKDTLNKKYGEGDLEAITKGLQSYVNILDLRCSLVLVKEGPDWYQGDHWMVQMYDAIRKAGKVVHTFYNRGSGNTCEMVVITPTGYPESYEEDVDA